ncbi:A24 family peptidase [Micromonospora sp. WMMA1363]|uniref:prepilin peptidase n=1 Tax=Micromonospora sp. WMMA1363 TaxID=3053985 RepID=UPI00259CD7BD|nr:A24 family peptidase [Micromonospora sp. WMMA1363]MDM4721793.1 A24 family peptidase [Micromonospora sp. WMMA1363]
MLLTLVAAATVAGAGWGMLVPGLVDRYAVNWPAGQPKPPWRGTCPDCATTSPPWWRSSGRCPRCGRLPVPGRAVTVPLGAVASGAVAAAVGPTWALPAFLSLSALAVPLALVDLRVLRLPDPLVGAALLGGAVFLPVAAVAEQAVPSLARAALAAVACAAGYLTLALLPRSPLGFGDVKLGVVLGLHLGWLGWPVVTAGVLLAPLVNLPLVAGLLVSRRAGWRTPVPYGPAMLGAALVALLVGRTG